jgi:ATP/maltotriose-dependent transcriptional regulator MalT
LKCDDIATEIEHNLRFLQSDLRNIPDRHQSIRAAFDHSWRLLNQEERSVFQRLAVFRGGFRHDAAGQVAGASLPILAALVRKSLVQVALDGRYQIHELLRQYAEERLAHSASDAVLLTRDHHCVYYTTFLSERDADMNGGRQLQAAAEIAAELDNVRAAWHQGIERHHHRALVGASNALYLFFQYRSRYREGVRLFEQAVQALDDETLAAYPHTTVLLYDLGWLCIRLGRLDQAEALFARCNAIQYHLGTPPDIGRSSDPHLGLGLLESLRGNYARARQLLEQAQQTSMRSGHLGNRRNAEYFLAGLHLAQGQNDAARRHAEAAYALAQQAQDRWFMAYCLNELGNAVLAQGEYEQARRHFQASYALREEFSDPEGMAVALTHLGAVTLLQHSFEEAYDFYRRGYAIYRDINDIGGLANVLDGLGRVRLAQGQVEEAAQHMQHALQIATSAPLIAQTLSLLVSIGELLVRTGATEHGVETLTSVRHHTAASNEARERVQRLLEAIGARPVPGEHSQIVDQETLMSRLQAELAALARKDVATLRGGRRAEPNMLESLTPREHELLTLLASGLSYQEIATQLVIAIGSVKSHAHNIYAKLGVRNRVEAAAHARDLGLL